jgi:hypothetical protein
MTARAQHASATRSAASPAVAQHFNRTNTHTAIQREANGARSLEGATSLVQDVLTMPGHPLDAGTRAVMEPRLGYDLSPVRVHDDSRAAHSAIALGATAYTSGHHIVFGQGRYAPQTAGGERLLAHELTHVAQQARGPVDGTPIGDGFTVSHPDDSFEREAAANATSLGSPFHPPASLQYLPSKADPARPLQRQDTWSGPTGAIAGIIGAALGAAALIIALVAWRRPANPAPTTGGITLNSQPISAADPAGVPAERQDAAMSAPTHTEKLLDVKTDGDNWADINFDVATDGVSIFSAIPQTQPHNYNGGTGGSSATINFAAPATVAAPLYDRTKPEPAKKDTGKKGAGKAGKGKEEAPPPPPAPKDTPGVLQVAFNGTNSVGEKEPLQQFAGRFVIRANPAGHRMVECVECVPRNQVGYAAADNQKIGHVDYHGHAAPAQQNTPPVPGPQQSQPNPPPPTGGK